MKKIFLEYGRIKLEIKVLDGKIKEIKFVKDIKEYSKDDFSIKVEKEILDYLKGYSRKVYLDFDLCGSEFQKKVWSELLKIPYGEWRSYKDIAINIGNPKGSRAVGRACRENKLPILIPCHRVVASNGKLTGFAGGIDIKLELIKIEGLAYTTDKKGVEYVCKEKC